MGSAASDLPDPQEKLLRGAERFGPDEAEQWDAWCASLNEPQAAQVPTLEAILSGLSAFRHLENLGHRDTGPDFGPHLKAFHAACQRALKHTGALLAATGSRARMRAVAVSDEPSAASDPASCLEAVHEALSTADRIAARLTEVEAIDAGAFQASLDVLLRELPKNRFFAPAEPLEFTNARALVSGSSFLPNLQAWRSEAARISMALAILSLVRCHRRLGLVRALVESGTPDVAHVVLGAVRRELRAITRFLLSQGVEALAEEFETRLLEVPAHALGRSQESLRATSKQLAAFRQGMEGLAIDLHAASRDVLDSALPPLGTRPETVDLASATEAIRRAQQGLKTTANSLRAMTLARDPAEHENAMAIARLRDEVWTFRFILRGFAAKASTSSVAADFWDHGGEDASFVEEFCRHFRVFVPRVTRISDYDRRGILVRAIGELERAEAPSAAMLDAAAREALHFAAHLDEVFEDLDTSEALRDKPFDKERAASALRRYLLSVKQLPLAKATAHPPAGAFKKGRLRPG